MAAPAISQLMPLPAFLRLLRRHGADPRYRGRVRGRILTGALLEPLRRYEELRWGRRLRDTRIDASPVFVLGYGRSGTTHLHYLFWQDPQFGMVTNYLANLYPVALTGRGVARARPGLADSIVYDADGNVTAHFDECDPYPPGTAPPVETTRFAALPIPDYRGLVGAGRFDTKSNWGLAYDLLASRDILYLMTPYTRRWGDVLVVRAKAFTTPHTPREPVYTPGKDIRGFTVATYGFWAGVCNAAVVDHEVARDREGWFTIVVSTEEDRPANARPEHGVTWLDWGRYLDGQLTFRFLLRRDPMLVALKEAVDGGVASGEIAPYVPRAVHCSRGEFEARGAGVLA